MIHKNLRMRDAIKIAERLGCKVRDVNRTGEMLVTHSAWPRPIRLNKRRTDTTQQLVAWLRKLPGAQEA